MGEFERATTFLARIGRYFCPSCRLTRTVVREASVTEVRCPKCQSVCLPATGDEETGRGCLP